MSQHLHLVLTWVIWRGDWREEALQMRRRRMKDMEWLRGKDIGRRAKKEKEMSKRRKKFSSSSVLPSLVIKGVGPFSFCSYTGEHLPHSSLNMKYPSYSTLNTTKLQQRKIFKTEPWRGHLGSCWTDSRLCQWRLCWGGRLTQGRIKKWLPE